MALLTRLDGTTIRVRDNVVTVRPGAGPDAATYHFDLNTDAVRPAPFASQNPIQY